MYVLLDDVPVSSGSSSNSSAIIGGAVGGVILLLMIMALMCIVILCMRRSHRKAVHSKNANVFIENNPAYDVTTVNTIDHSYSTIKPGDSDIFITANPCYAVPAKPSKASEDECNYAQLNECNEYLDLEDTIKIDQRLYMDNVHQFCAANNVQTSNESEYGVVNQPKSDGPDYKIT